jgi:hypothetical protein
LAAQAKVLEKMEERKRQAEERRKDREEAERRHLKDMAQRLAQHQENLDFRQKQMLLSEEHWHNKNQPKPLKESEIVKLEGFDAISIGLDKLLKDFKPEYASLGVFGFGANFDLEARRRLGDKTGREAVSWWSRYNQLQAPNRHALFGATLTGNELKNYQSFTAKPSDNPDVVKDYLRDQINYTQDTAEQRRRAFESSGYKVPETRARDFTSTFGGRSATAAPANEKTMPTGEKLQAYADSHFNGDEAKAREYLSTQGYK